jgi:hypothetical protein
MEKPQTSDRKSNSTSHSASASRPPYVVDSTAALEVKDGDHSTLSKYNAEADDAELVPIAPAEPTSSMSPRLPTQPRRLPAAAKHRSPAKFRRLWEVKQSQEMQQLGYQAQVQQINQVLVDRAKARVQSGQVASSGSAAYSSYSLPERLTPPSRQGSFTPIQESVPMPQANQSPEDFYPPAGDRVDRESRLASSAKQFVPPESAQIQQTVLSSQTSNPLSSRAFTPQQEGFAVQPPASRLSQEPLSAAQWQQAEQEAGQTAAALRYFASRERVSTKGTDSPTPPFANAPAKQSNPPKRWNLHPQGLLDKIGDAVLWIVGAAAVRFAANLLLASIPSLTPIVTLLLFVPAILAIVLTFFVPNASFLIIYRLFLISIGLLLGGKL